MASGAFEPDEIGVFLRQLLGVKVCIDIGANIGFYTCLAAKHSKHVIAVEPTASNLQLLYKNLVNNGFQDTEVFPLGLADKVGLNRMFGSGTGASFVRGWAGASPAYSDVPVTTLDIIVNSRFDGIPILIKIDVEGYEYPLLQGSARTLKLDPKPVWLVEVCLTEHFPGGLNQRFYETFDTFWRNGYHSTVADAEHRSVEPADVSRWVKQGFVDFGSHNYLFRCGAGPITNTAELIEGAFTACPRERAVFHESPHAPDQGSSLIGTRTLP
jgi:FkbM family methyltransferase